MKKAVLLMSGGADSTTVAAIAESQGFELYGLSFSYEQVHAIELEKAKMIAKKYCKEHRITKLDLSLFGGSALTDKDIEVPKFDNLEKLNEGVAVTYVPARNTIFLSIALAWAEIIGATDIFMGANKTDYDTYPDCRPEYIKAFEDLSNLATRAGVHDRKSFKIHTPLIQMSKQEVIKTGLDLDVDYSQTLTCYNPTAEGYACGHCTSCLIRLDAFKANHIKDPVAYI